VNPLAIELMQSSEQSTPPIAVLLPPSTDVPTLPGITLYRVADSSDGLPKDGTDLISYERLIDMIFTADKVVAW
jgi:hypothetical protein